MVPGSRPLRGWSRQMWLSCRSKFRLLQLREKHAQGAIEDDCRIAVGNGMPQEVLSPPKLVIRFA